jgi:hypothetical protein
MVAVYVQKVGELRARWLEVYNDKSQFQDIDWGRQNVAQSVKVGTDCRHTNSAVVSVRFYSHYLLNIMN